MRYKIKIVGLGIYKYNVVVYFVINVRGYLNCFRDKHSPRYFVTFV
jgi:hypothetical protein